MSQVKETQLFSCLDWAEHVMYGALATTLQPGGMPGGEENMGEEQSRKVHLFLFLLNLQVGGSQRHLLTGVSKD